MTPAVIEIEKRPNIRTETTNASNLQIKTEVTIGTSAPRLITVVPTSGSSAGFDTVSTSTLLLLSYPKVFNHAIQALTKIKDKSVIDQTLNILKAIKDIFDLERERSRDIEVVKPIWPSFFGDGSVIFEIIYPEFRLGIGVDINPAYSSWFLVSKENLGSINAQGYLTSGDLQKQLWWLISYVLTNA